MVLRKENSKHIIQTGTNVRRDGVIQSILMSRGFMAFPTGGQQNPCDLLCASGMEAICIYSRFWQRSFLARSTFLDLLTFPVLQQSAGFQATIASILRHFVDSRSFSCSQIGGHRYQAGGHCYQVGGHRQQVGDHCQQVEGYAQLFYFSAVGLRNWIFTLVHKSRLSSSSIEAGSLQIFSFLHFFAYKTLSSFFKMQRVLVMSFKNFPFSSKIQSLLHGSFNSFNFLPFSPLTKKQN